MTTTFQEYQLFQRTETRQREIFISRAQNERDIAYFSLNFENVQTVDDFVNDDRLYRFALTAFGLESQIFAKGLIRTLLEEGTEDPAARANRQADSRFRDLVNALGFSDGTGTRATFNPQVRQLRELTEARDARQAAEASLSDAIRNARLAGQSGDTPAIEAAREVLADAESREASLAFESAEEREDRLLTQATQSVENARERLLSEFAIFRQTGDSLGLDLARNGLDNARAAEAAVREQINQERAVRLEQEAREVQNFNRTTIARTVDQYIKTRLEQELGERNTGAQLAAYFTRQIEEGQVNSYFGIFADRALFEVARVSLGLPQQVLQGDLDRLAQQLEDRLPIEDLINDREVLDQFVQRFAVRYDIETGNLSGGGASRLGLVTGLSAPQFGLSSGVLETIASLPGGSLFR